MKKYFHIITVGNSIITNYQKHTGDETIKKLKTSSQEWKDLLDNSQFLNEIFNFLKENPRENSAEVNSFEGYCEKKEIKVNKENCLIYLTGTKTSVNEIAVRTLERYFKEKVTLLNPKEISGYFWEKEIDEKIAVDEFSRGISELLDTLLKVAMKKKEEGYEVVFNPTGGMKPHVITCALAGFMTGSEIYYIHEEFEKKDIVILPPLLYLPRGREIELMKEIRKSGAISGYNYEKLKKEYREEIDRLLTYSIVEVDTDEQTGEEYRIRLTNKGKLVYTWLVNFL
jgi:putative CRISPR-associated protein (TIGR02619 family)